MCRKSSTDLVFDLHLNFVRSNVVIILLSSVILALSVFATCKIWSVFVALDGPVSAKMLYGQTLPMCAHVCVCVTVSAHVYMHGRAYNIYIYEPVTKGAPA